MFALMQLVPQVFNGGFAIHHFAAPDLLHAAGDFVAQLCGVRADEFLLRAQHTEALGDDIGSGTIMAVLQLLGDELLLFGCQCYRHGLNKRQFSTAVKSGNKSWSQPFAVGLVVAVPAAQGGGAGVGEKKWQRRRFNVAVAKYHVGFAYCFFSVVNRSSVMSR
jgi:hypothetical protein